VTYCPTEDMVADFFTKPLQGSAFIRFRNFLLNVDSLIDSTKNLRSVLGNGTGPGPKNTNTNTTTTRNIDDVEKSVKVNSGNDIQSDWVLVAQKEVNKEPKVTKA